MKRNLLLFVAAIFLALPLSAQRVVDRLDRGVVAVKTSKGVFVSWRIQSEEYFDVTYNLYRDGVKVAENLDVSNYTDAAGTTTSTYQVAAVVRGVEQDKSKAAATWGSDYLEITPKHDASLVSTYIPNDATCADVDGDGEVEILMKYNNNEEGSAGYPKGGNKGEYTLFEVLKLDGTVLWWVNCGPNMGDFQNNEQNIVGYDWDRDGKAEVVMRLAEGSVVHYANGETYTIGADGKNGTAWTNHRIPKTGGVEWFTYYGNEFLYYANGQTGEPYQCITYPLKRYEDGETDLSKAWGDGYGHRSSKYFFGAPYLDGRKPSIFLGRGIYTRHKFIAYDVDPATHELKVRWRWDNNSPGPWYGQGYHNYAIADVDLDGRDEIIWGSMVIDDNGKGLSTAGLGHGDAQHQGDLNPYVHGLEGFFCNESAPANNYRDMTTSKIYHRYVDGNDDGRAIAGNFNDKWPGAMGFSAHDDAISCVTGEKVDGMTKNGVGMNFRCYWDGDLCEETYNGGDNTMGSISKYEKGVIKNLTGSLTNNSTKATPCFMGDILGDWREEFVVRTPDHKIRIFTTTHETPWRNYSLWYDHQYRNGMVWQPCGYNQPPHVSYFLGELEGITVAPPSLGMTGRTEIANGATISGTDGTLITCETNDMEVTVADGASPYIYIDNAPTWVQGSAPSEATLASYPITYTTYTHTLKGGAFAGAMRLIKQGDGVLVLPAVEQKYTGNTDVWAGTLSFDGTLVASRLWLNRHTTLATTGGKFLKGIQADYDATIKIGADTVAGTLNADSLILNFGSIVEIDIFSEGLAADRLNANVLKIEKKVWPNGHGPVYDTPVFRITAHKNVTDATIAEGKYCLGSVGAIDGDIANIVIEGMSGQKTVLSYSDGKLYLDVKNFVAQPMTWVGDVNANWNLDTDANFKSNSTSEAATFVTGSDVTFDDNATVFDVVVKGSVSPASITFANNTKTYTLSGDSIVGGAPVMKTGNGIVRIRNVNRTGNTVIKGGTLYATHFANTIGNDYGSLGDRNKTITLQDGATLGVNTTATSSQRLLIGDGKLNVASGATFTQAGSIGKPGSSTAVTTLTKVGGGTLVLPTGISLNKLIIQAGTVDAKENASSLMVLPATVEFQGGTLADANGQNSYSTNNANFIVPEGKSGKFILDPRCEYKGSLSGGGTFTVVAAGVRNNLNGNWSAFEGELIVGSQKRGSYDPSFDWKNSYGLPYATLNVPAGQSFHNNGNTVAIKTLKGSSSASGTLDGAGTYVLGEHHNGDINIYAYINSPVVYKGKAERELRIASGNAERINQTVRVESGALRFTSTSSSKKLCHGAYLTTVQGTGKVYGSNARFHAVKAQNGGVLSITGTNDAPTTITTEGDTTIIASAGVLDLKIKSATSASKLVANKGLSFLSGAVVKVCLDEAFTPALGDAFTLWQASTVAGCDSTSITLELPALPEGLAWDTSELYAATGVLKVVKDESASIGNIPASTALEADVISLDGKVLGRIATTKAALSKDVRRVAGAPGCYIVRFVSGTNTESVTVVVE